jgi:hypothetical protein
MSLSRCQVACIVLGDAFVGLLPFGSTALALDDLPPPRPRGVCKAALDKFCSDIKPGGGRLSACVKLHAAEVSPECIAATDKRWRLASSPADDRCIVYGSTAETTAEWTMIITNDGTPCEINRDIAGTPATSVTVRQAPSKGRLLIDGSAVRYTPNATFTGDDLFEVQWFGMAWGPYSPVFFNLSPRATIQVIVRAK